MVRVLLIDDEPFALVYLERMLKELDQIQVISSHTNPLEAIEIVAEARPDIVFVDIHMPEMNGLQVAEHIQSVCPLTEIVFLTAYDQYALDAFDLNAMDYLLKPLQPSRLQKTLDRLERRRSTVYPEPALPSNVMVYCLGLLQYQVDGNPPQLLKWRTAKTEELFAYLFHHRTTLVYKEALIDLLWPSLDYKRASTYLYTTIYQLRKILKEAGVPIQLEKVSGKEGYVLDLQKVTVDTEIWEKAVQELGKVTPENCEKFQVWLEFYRGDYLGDYDYIWAESERERLRSVWLHHAMEVAVCYTEQNKLSAAISMYQRIVQLHPYYEEAHLGLMKVYRLMGHSAAVEEQFRNIHEMLKEELGVDLPADIRAWYAQWAEEKRR